MGKETSKGDNTVITSDKYISESGLQGGKVIGDHLALGSFIAGIPLLFIGIFALISMVFDLGFPKNNAVIILSLVITAIGLLLVIGGYSIYTTKHAKK